MKYLILGAGPAGLSFANRLLESGEDSFVVLEQEETAGGLCRSAVIDGSPLDIGGGHFLDTRSPDVNDFLFRFMPESEWELYSRKTTVYVNGNEIGQPIEAYIWQMNEKDQAEYLRSMAEAGCNTGEPMPEHFADWIYWKLGKKIAEDYMIPYNRKLFGRDFEQLGTYWLEKLPNVSYEETLRSCREKRPFGRNPGHTKFYYPKKNGFGELWLRMGAALKDRIIYNAKVRSIDFRTKEVTTADGSTYKAKTIITTVPWTEFEEIFNMPVEIRSSIKDLKYCSIQVEYHPEMLETNSQWIYFPDMELPYHRILVRHNFCPNSSGYWTETNSERVAAEPENENFRHMNKYAYPISTIGKTEIMKKLLDWSKAQGVYGLGRWGEHNFYNADIVVGLAMDLADRMLSK